MENEFVTYEQALALKELGCGVIMNYKYWKVGKNILVFRNNYNMQFIIDRGFDVECLNVYAPLKQQVFRWFRDRYLLDGLILPQDQSALSPLPLYFTAVISYNDGILKELFNTTNKDDLLHYDTYEEAENACIDKLIEIAKQHEK